MRTTASSARRSARPVGRVVKSMGDGYLATFDGPARAISQGGRDRRRVQKARDRGSHRHTVPGEYELER